MFQMKRVIVALVLLLVCKVCVNWLIAPSATSQAATVQSDSVNPAQLNDFALCDAWRVNESDTLERELLRRHFLSTPEYAAAYHRQVYVGMSRMGVYCALGAPENSKSYVTASGVTDFQTHRAAPGEQAVTVRLENGVVVSYSY